MTKGVSREDAIKAFQPFDTDGNGTAEVVTMLDAVSTYTGPNMMGELGKNIRMLQACSLLPGFVDVYAGDTNPIFQHGEKILKLRLSVLKNVFNALKDAAREDGEDQVLAEGEELKSISRCYSSIEVSTNSSDAYRLINIKRCHSDGCDTRVHGIKTLGYKVVRDSGMSVVDASAKWYLQILAATVSATVPQSPALRGTVLEYTRAGTSGQADPAEEVGLDWTHPQEASIQHHTPSPDMEPTGEKEERPASQQLEAGH
nr:hypothetical protein BaRGS_013930 [Batillaria attramentaria]